MSGGGEMERPLLTQRKHEITQAWMDIDNVQGGQSDLGVGVLHKQRWRTHTKLRIEVLRLLTAPPPPLSSLHACLPCRVHARGPPISVVACSSSAVDLAAGGVHRCQHLDAGDVRL